MKDLLSTYKDILEDTDKWKYYNKLKIAYSPFKKENAWRFIEDYYKAGVKERVFNPHITQESIRPLHSVSVFFLGILLKEIILKNTNEDDLKPDFRYLWFLTSLFHDYAFILENKKKNIVKNESIYDLKGLKHYFKIYECDDIFENGFDGKFNLEIINLYLKYLINIHKKIDHGILGGLLLYKGLKDNYEIMYKEKLVKHPHTNYELFKYKGLLWSECQFDNFKRIARAIIYHNIWFCYKGKDSQEKYEKCKKDYQDFGLSRLVIEDKKDLKKKHKVSEDPFLLLLILADTIEPIKFFKEEDAKDVLSNIYIENSENTILITVTKKFKGLEKWFEKIIDLKNWTTISIQKKDDQKLIISNF